jgi:colanic acid/amylovoran biosynthesis glycosyltransferase
MAVIVSRFPKVTETFQLREILTLRALGVPIELFPIIHMPEEGIQDDTAELDRAAHYLRLASLEVIRAQLIWLKRNPRAYLRAWAWAAKAYRRAPDFLVRSVMLIPLAAAMALRMERLGIEHVHAHYATHPTHVAMVIHQLTGLTYSFTGHAHDLRLRTDGLIDKIDQAEFYFTCTTFSAEDLREKFGERADKGVVVYHGVDIDAFKVTPAPEPVEGLLRIVMVGSFEECKGHAYLLQAVKELNARGLRCEVTLIGGNLASGHDYQSVIRALGEELGISDQLEFTGKLPSSAVRERIAAADLGCLPCCRTPAGNMDGLPNFLTECLAMGRPVVSTTLPGVLELVTPGEEGLLVRSRDALALADALETLARDPDMRARLAINGRATVEKLHNMRTNTEQLLEVYLARVGRPQLDHG